MSETSQTARQPAGRDPKTDPQPGDILHRELRLTHYRRGVISSHTVEREVSDRDGATVSYVGPDVCEPSITLKTWRRWAKAAKVVRIGPAAPREQK